MAIDKGSGVSPIDWLCANSPGFAELPEEDRQAIFHFSLLWSFFEAKTLGTSASAKRILVLTHEWASQGQLSLAAFEESLSHFRQRYYLNGSPTEHLQGLGLRSNDSPALVHAVLKGANTDPADSIAVLLIIIYRLRNNLFHGVKWAYGIRGQLANFTFANAALINALAIPGSW